MPSNLYLHHHIMPSPEMSEKLSKSIHRRGPLSPRVVQGKLELTSCGFKSKNNQYHRKKLHEKYHHWKSETISLTA